MKKLYYSLILITIFFTQPALGQFSGGTGTSGDPFQISTATDLDNIRNYRDGDFFLQTADIDLSSITNWMPIGSAGYETRFRGTYDGNGFTISNLTINRPGTDNVGLFGEIGPTNSTSFTNATIIKNVGLVNVSVTGGRGTGSLVGRVTGNENTTIQSCYVIGGTVTGDAATGGLVGSNNSYISDEEDFDGRKPKIIKSYAAVDVVFSDSGSDNQKFGGLAGCNQKGRIENSYSKSTVTVQPSGTGAAERVGGLVGCSDFKGDIINSYSMGLVTVNSNVTLSGGLLGSIDTSYPGTISGSYWDTETSGQTTSAGGDGRTTAQMQSQVTFSGWDFTSIWNIMEGETYPFLRDFDLSGFNITDPGVQTAGAPFEINITNAKDVGGNLLDGSYSVTVTSNLTTEGTGSDGILVNNLAFTFTGGDASITGIFLKKADNHTLTVDVGTILETKEQLVTVNPGQAFKLVIDQQPATPISGNHNDEPAGLGTITVVSHDEYDNPSSVGLDAGQLVTASIENDGSTGNDAVLGGTLSADIQSGSASFNDLTIDKEGTGYTLAFTSVSPVSLAPAVSSAFDVENIVDHSGFVVSHPGTPQYQYVEFDLDITGATDQTGAALEGPVNVVVSSNTEGIVYNLNVEFTAGAGSLTVALEEIAEHTLTIDVTGITLNESMVLSVAQDQSAFSITAPGQQYQDFPFDLEITGAKGRDGINLTGEHQVTVTSDMDLQVYSGNINFTDGQGFVPVTLNTTGDHILNVSITDITENVSVGVNVGLNNSGFDLSGPVLNQVAGVDTTLTITNARTADNGNLNGNYNVTVTSNISGEGVEGVVFSASVTFFNGVPDPTDQVTFNLKKVASAPGHTLTVSIQSITPTKTVDVNVEAAAASQLAVTQQPSGGSGSGDGTPVNVGTVIVETRDFYGNPSVSGLAAEQNVTVAIENDPSAANDASLGGPITLDIQSGTATFSDLTLDRDGEGYILRFTSASPVNLGSVDTELFNITNIEDISGFDIIDPGPQLINDDFEIRLISAKNNAGVLLNGDYTISMKIEIPGFGFLNHISNRSQSFVDGQTIIITQFGNLGTYNNEISVQSITSKEYISITYVENDLSELAITSPGTQTAGTPFSLNITGAKNKAGGNLDGRKHYVTLTSDNLDEGVNGVLFSDSLFFTGGGATIPEVQLLTAEFQDLTVTIDWVTNPVTESVTIDAANASQLLVTQQPVNKTGNFDDIPVNVGPVSVRTIDDYGNFSIGGLGGTQSVSVNIGTNPGSAVLTDGTGEVPAVDISSGTAVFNNLFLNKDGTGYVLNFTYNGTPTTMTAVGSEPFDITNVEDRSEFVVDHPGLQYSDVPFDLVLYGAVDNTGTELNGTINVTVTSDKADGEVYNNDVTFTDGVATVTISLNTITNETDGHHNLTVSVTGVKNDVVINDFIVEADPGILLSAPVSLEPLDFGPLTVGYDPVSPVTVTITRTGSGSITGLNAVLEGTNASEFTIGSLSSDFLNDEMPEATFIIVPKSDLNPGTYNATVTVTDEGTISESFNVQFVVLDSYAIGMEYGTQITLDATNPLVYDAETEGYTAIIPTEVTINNAGTGDITNLLVEKSGADALNYTISQPLAGTLTATASTTFNINPNHGLPVGTYNATVTVTASNGVSEHFDVSFEVLVQYAISLNPEGPVDFGIRSPGYTAITPEEITVTRTGTGNITTLSADMSGDEGGGTSDFTITGPGATTLDGTTNSTTFTVSPKSSLPTGLFEETVTITADNGVVESFTVSFRVVDEVVWQGTTSDWHAAGNWNGGIVPDQYVVISIPATDNDPVISGANATVNELVIENGASLTVNSPRRLAIRNGGKLTIKPGGLLYSTGTLVNNAGSGGLVVESDGSATGSVIQSSSGVQATVQRHNSVQGWHIVSPPVGGEGVLHFVNNAANNIPQNPGGDYAMTHYVEDLGVGAGGWGSYYNSSTSGNLMPGKGYLLAINVGYSAYFTGELPYSGRTVSITRGANGWNAIGNPFSSAMGVTTQASSDNFLGVNASELDPNFAALYIYDPVGKDYKIINNSQQPSGLTDGYIQAGQGFMVKSKTGGGSINFTTGMRDHFSSAPFKSASTNWSKIGLKVSDENKQSTTLLAFNSNMTNGLDLTYDAGQYGADPGFRLYSRLVEEGNEVDFAIQALPDYELEDMIIPVGFDFAEGGEVVFSVEELSMPAGASAVLEDRHLEVFTDLGKTDYIVTLDENSSGTGRFFVHTDIMITNADDMPGDQGEQLEIYSYGKEIFILGEVGHNSYVTLFDLLGRQVKTVKLENVDRNSFRVDELGKGIYLVRVSGEGAIGAKRVFIE